MRYERTVVCVVLVHCPQAAASLNMKFTDLTLLQLVYLSLHLDTMLLSSSILERFVVRYQVRK